MKEISAYSKPFLAILIFIYGLDFYLTFSYQRVVDFIPFYISIKELILGLNPYPISKKLPANLNPPFFLFIFYPLGLLSYRGAIISWSIFSFILGLIGARFAFIYIFSEVFRKKYKLILYLFYLSLFPILMDISIGQVGSILFFFIMLGYHFYLGKKDYLAGIFWGLIIALKFFPALLFFYVLKQGRRKVFFIMLAAALVATLIPLLIYGPALYHHYLSMMSSVYWYGDNWNASLYGYLYRLMMDLKKPGQPMLLLNSLYLILFFILLLLYLKAMGPKDLRGKTELNHQPFCLTLAMMVMLSPFGWIYYFSLLFLPLMLIGLAAFHEKTKFNLYLLGWTLSFLLLNYPQAYLLGMKMENLTEKLFLYSVYFYGLALLIILIICRQNMPGNNELNIKEVIHDKRKSSFVSAICIWLILGLIVPLNSFLINISLGYTGGFNTKELNQLLLKDSR